MSDDDATPRRRRDTVVGTFRELVRETIEDDAVDAAASVAFWLLLSLPAALLAGLASLSLLGDEVTNELRRVTLEFVDRVFTSEADTLRVAIDGVFDQPKAGLFSISVALAWRSRKPTRWRLRSATRSARPTRSPAGSFTSACCAISPTSTAARWCSATRRHSAAP